MGIDVGDIIHNKYQIIRMIGEGGMGSVYEGENTLIARRVAIKVLHGSAAVNQDIVERFQREAQAAGRIGNDHILDVLDLGTLGDGDLFMVMEFLAGENLADRIDRLGRLTPQQVYPLMRQTLEGLKAAHDAGIIHRDLKPENLFILEQKAGNQDYVKIIDFGISKFNVMDGSNMGMTATGAVMGTPYYMAPEVAKGVKGADHRSDIYALGVILYKAVTGDEPFSAETFNELLFKIVLSDLVPARQIVPDLDPAFDSIISKAMAKDADHRFASCDDMIQALDAWAHTGAGVTVPPPEHDDPRVRAGLAQVPGAPPVPGQAGDPSQAHAAFSQSDSGAMVPPGLGHQTPGAHTPGSWANQSTATAAAPKKSLLPLLAAGGAVVLLVLLIGVVGIFKVMGSSSDSDEASEAAAAGEESSGDDPAESTESAPATETDTPDEPSAEAAASASAAPDATAAATEEPAKPDQPAAKAPTSPKPRPVPARPTRPTKPKPGGGRPDFGY